MNHANYISDCIKSILSQDYQNIEILYLDNCSKDSSYEIATDLLKNSDKVAFMEKRQMPVGVCENLNYVLRRAKGTYCALISSDDYMLQERIKQQVEAFKQLSEEYGVVFSDALLVDENNHKQSQTFIEKLKNNTEIKNDTFQSLLEGNFIPAMSTMIKFDLIKQVGYYDETLIYEDFDMWLKLAKISKFYYLHKVLAAYRITPSSLEKKMGEKGLTDKIDIYYKHLSNNSYRSIILDKIRIYTNDLYSYNYPSFLSYARRVLLIKFSLKTLLFVILESLRIKMFKIK